MRSIEPQSFEQANDRISALLETYNDHLGRRFSADASLLTEQSGCHCHTFPAEPIQPCGSRNDCQEETR